MQTEVAEVGEPVAEGRGGSSTMPHKRNPVACAAILTAAQRTPGLMATPTPANPAARAGAGRLAGGVETLPDLITLVGGALAQSEALVRDMQVFPQKMRADLDIAPWADHGRGGDPGAGGIHRQSRGASSYRGAVPSGAGPSLSAGRSARG